MTVTDWQYAMPPDAGGVHRHSVDNPKLAVRRHTAWMQRNAVAATDLIFCNIGALNALKTT